MDEAVERKKAWRGAIAAVFSLMPAGARGRFDAALTERVGDFAFGSGAKMILGYAPMRDEPDISGFFRRWAAEGGGLALPVWLGGSRMLARRVTDWDGQLSPGRGGIAEPDASLPEVPPSELDLVVTPGRAFSERCDRLGRGAGCYDALFRETRAARIGVAYDFQVFPAIAAGGGDVPLDAVITPSRLVGRDETR